MTASHELSHQWFGDSVSVRYWNDIWLNEGFATFAQYLWYEHEHPSGLTATQILRHYYNQIPARNDFWHQQVAEPQRDTMFSQAVYYRGGMTLAALRQRIGSALFFEVLQQWTAAHRYGNATTAQFIALAEKVSGQDLGAFFHAWLYSTSKPATFQG
jgi:aminopeptidase N